ncbi:MAG: MTAP family purine nucleoside phosphorylase [Bacteroidales bacterium]|nr:MTAP family purine nucleoside phosphorylase [Bacteroidales bacterium]MDD4603757.1 MTAP family purine nucleoside phosphorylase [Bacteroidales bacterium]
MVKIGLIGGSGLEKLNIFQKIEEIQVETPCGMPSSTFFHGTTGNCEIYILSRHGRQHTITPSQVNNRANVDAFRQLGCQYILATTACGSLRDEIQRGDIVIPDQFIDFTRLRVNTFYDHFNPGEVKHTPMADPFSQELRLLLINGCKEMGLNFHPAGTIVTIEGPRFSTRAESKMFRLLGADVINMSIAPEAALANEAGIPYACIALSTDYDSWKQDEEPVTWDCIWEVFTNNVKHVTELIVNVLEKF